MIKTPFVGTMKKFKCSQGAEKKKTFMSHSQRSYCLVLQTHICVIPKLSATNLSLIYFLLHFLVSSCFCVSNRFNVIPANFTVVVQSAFVVVKVHDSVCTGTFGDFQFEYNGFFFSLMFGFH